MRVATKINLMIIAVIMASLVANHWAMTSTVLPKFNDLEQAYATANHNRIIDAISSTSGKVMSSAQDYGTWDDTYDFMRGRSEKTFLTDNFTVPANTLNGLGLNAIVFRKLDGSIHWGEAVDLKTKQSVPQLVKELTELPFKHPYLSGSGDPLAKTGLMQSSYGLVMVAVAPILKSDLSGPATGEILTATLFDTTAAEALTGVDFTITWITPENRPETATVHSVIAGQVLQSTSLISGISGKPLAILKSSTIRDITSIGSEVVWKATLTILAAAIAVLLVLWIALRQLVIGRLVALNDHLANAANSGDILKFRSDNCADEIGQVTQSFNAMADQVNHLRDMLADSSYKSGMSEWAAGTLHNVRNGLNPVTVAAWRLNQLFDPAWLDNVKTALDDYERADVPAERREKLKDYLIASAARILPSAEEVKELAKQIEAANKSVLDITTEFEKHARREAELEPIDLLPLVKEVANSVVQAHSKSIGLEVAGVPGCIVANKTILRQVLTNIFINATEAMDSCSKKCQIVVALRDHPGNSSRLSLSISDNGEGIAPDRLKSIFERGHSSRTHRSGGLGLHWCANAMNAMGGSINAYSRGEGHGATFTLTLKTTNTISKEAA